MTNIHKLQIEPMTAAGFAAFGELWEAPEQYGDQRIMSPTGYTHDGRTAVHVIWQPHAGFRFGELERHFGVTQSFVQLSGSPAVVCAAAPSPTDHPSDLPDPAEVHAFLIDPAKAYSFKRGTWHSLNRYPLHPPGASFLILNSDPNPTQIVNYEIGTGTIYRDLGSAKEAEIIDHEGLSSVVFEIAQ